MNCHVTSFSRVQSTSSFQWDNIMNMFCFLGGYFRAMRGLAVAVDCFIKIPSGLRPNLVFQLPSDLRSYEPNLYAFGSAPGPRNSGVSLTSGRRLRLRPFTSCGNIKNKLILIFISTFFKTFGWHKQPTYWTDYKDNIKTETVLTKSGLRAGGRGELNN